MNTTNFFKMLGRAKKGEIVKLNIGTFAKYRDNTYRINLDGHSFLLLEYKAKGVRWHWIGMQYLFEKSIEENISCCQIIFDKPCKRHEILKVLFDILGREIEELKQ